MDARDSTTSMKFAGNLEAKAGSNSELGKERFLSHLKLRVQEHGQETFYFVRDTNGQAVDLFENAHYFKPEDVIRDFEARCLFTNTGDDAFDPYELAEVTMSRLVVESLLSHTFRETLEIRYGHRADYRNLSGACLLMMALETCHASTAHDVDAAISKFEALSLKNYPGENIATFSTEAQRLIKIMMADYALPVKSGSALLYKVSKTSSEYFNRKIFAFLDEVKDMEHKYKLADPKSITKDPAYSKLGPLAIIDKLREEYSRLCSDLDWPALATKLPQGNNAPASERPIKCFRCGGPHHIKVCPEPKDYKRPDSDKSGNDRKHHSNSKSSSNSSSNSSQSRSNNNSNNNTGKERTFRALAAWKYLEPKDLSTVVKDENGKEWKFCTKCMCRATKKKGYFQLSHFDKDHVDNWKPKKSEGNLTSVADPNPIPSGPPDVTTTEPDDSSVTPGDIVFMGMWCAPVDAPSFDSSIATTVEFVPALSPSVERENVCIPHIFCHPCGTTNVDDIHHHLFNVDDIFFDCDDNVLFDDVVVSSEHLLSSNILMDLERHVDIFHDCYDELVEPFILKRKKHRRQEVAFYDPELPPLSAAWLRWWCKPKPSYFRAKIASTWHSILLYLFWFATLFWDTLAYLLVFPRLPLLSRDQRRNTRQSRMRSSRSFCFLPSTWMVLSACIMVMASAYQGSPPNFPFTTPSEITSNISKQGAGAFSRIKQIDELVDLNLGTLRQFHGMKYTALKSALGLQKVDCCIGDLISNAEMSEYFDSYQFAPKEPLYFFDASDYPSPSFTDFDPFDFDNLSKNTINLDCVYKSGGELLQEFTLQPEVNAPTVQAISGLTQLELLATDPDVFMSVGDRKQPIIFDTGASLSITFDRADFDGPLTIPPGDLRLGGMANGLKIEGIGPVTWTFENADGSEIKVRSQCYYVPSCRARLLSPQRLFNRDKGVGGHYQGDENAFRICFNGCPELIVEYDERNHLPIGYARVGEPSRAPQVNLVLSNEDNQNLSAGQKLLLQWHSRFGHLNFTAVQRILRSFPFTNSYFASAAKCDMNELRCEICHFAKAHRRPLKSSTSTATPERNGALRADHLGPGVQISVDHFESRLRGRTYDSFGKVSSDTYVGGCIFVDHGSGYIRVEHQLGFSAVETIRAKQNYEQHALDHGVIVQSYLTDSGAFKANTFVQHIRNHEQRLRFCGTNAHHQNGVAERAIRTISDMARAMILHASCHWNGGIDSSLWPMAVQYATHVYNTTPGANGLCPADIFTGSTVPRHRLRDIHVWGCPVYVLDPSLQAGKKLPKWQPRSRRGVFVGLSSVHSSEVPQVLNLQTGSITTQFHVVFDDRFSTVASIGPNDDPPEHWASLCLENVTYVPTDSSEERPVHLHDDWLTPSERARKYRDQQRSSQIRTTFPSAPPLSTTSTVTPTATVPVNPTATSSSEEVFQPSAVQVPTTASEGVPTTVSEGAASSTSMVPTAPSVPPDPSPADPPLRRSSRSFKGTRTATRFQDEVYLSHVDPLRDPECHDMQLAYLAGLYTCLDTGDSFITDPRVYASKIRKTDADNPSFQQAIHGDHAEQYIEAMKKEVATLVHQNTWVSVPRQPGMNVLKGTWVFKLKRLPDGTPYRYKSRYCARGDLQREGVDFFEAYAPVVQWSTIRLLLSTVLTEGWTTRQVDYTNAFAQAELREDVDVEFPKLFAPSGGGDWVLKLLKSLYGLRQAPKTFFEKLREGLLERGYTQSNIDPCLFMKEGIMCVVYVDDTIFAGADPAALEREIKNLGVADSEQRHTFALRNEGEVGAFLGIQIEKSGPRTFTLTQIGLIDKVLAATKFQDCNGVDTPSTTTALGADMDGTSFQEAWDYRSVIGMLMYLSSNTRPDISYAVHQAARFSHAPKNSHAMAVKRILRYLKKTRDKGLVLSPGDKLTVDCYVDSDFGGLFASEDKQDPISVKSRTGYVILYRGSPLLWVSKLQTQIALSTMEAEYIALSQAMRDLIPIREILKEIMTTVFHRKDTIVYTTKSKAFSDVSEGTTKYNIEQSTVYEDNESCLKFARMPKLTPRTKHIGIPYHWFRTKVEQLEIEIEPIDTNSQLADQFTKGLATDKFRHDSTILMGW